MPIGRHCLSAAALMLVACSLSAGWGAAVAQSPAAPQPRQHGVPADDDMTLVVATRFVAPTDEQASPKAMFDKARVPEANFNETDRCVDEHALEIAQEYFNGLGRLLGKAGFVYVVPDAEIGERVSICEKQHGRPPQAWVAGKTKLIAFGRVVPSADAAGLQQSLR